MLGTPVIAVGLIEGIAEATAAIVKVFSGALSDRLGNRKWLAAAGSGLAARFIDRVGKGIHLVTGGALLAASLVAGALWDLIGPAGTFLGGAGFAALAIFALWRLMPRLRKTASDP